MDKPDPQIDGADVIIWSRSIGQPFFWVGNPKDPEAHAIHGLVIAKYRDSSDILRFSCDSEWKVIQDGTYESEEEAIESLHDLYCLDVINWKSF